MLTELVLEVLAREGLEDPVDGREVLVVEVVDELGAERVGRLEVGEGLVRGGGDDRVVGEELGALGVGEKPVEEVRAGLLGVLVRLGVDREVVLGAERDAGLVLTVDADVDRHEVDVLLLDGVAVDVGDLGPRPLAVLDEGALPEGELGHGVGDRLGGGLRRLDRRVVEVEVEDLLVVLRVGEPEVVGVRDLVVAELVEDRVVREVRLPAPVLTGGERGAGEGALDAQVVLLGLDVLREGLELVESLDLVDGGDDGAVHREVLLQDGVVVDDAVALGGERRAVDGAVIGLERHGVVGEGLDEVRVGKVEGVVLPGGKADRAVDVEDRGRVGLGDLALEGLPVGAGGSGDDLDGDAGLLLVGGGDLLEGLLRLGLEVEEVDAARAGSVGGVRAGGVRAVGAGGERGRDGGCERASENGATGDGAHGGPRLDTSAWAGLAQGALIPTGLDGEQPAPSATPHPCTRGHGFLQTLQDSPAIHPENTLSPLQPRGRKARRERGFHPHADRERTSPGHARRPGPPRGRTGATVCLSGAGSPGRTARGAPPAGRLSAAWRRSRRSRGARRPRRRGRPCRPQRPCPTSGGRRPSCCRPRRRS